MPQTAKKLMRSFAEDAAFEAADNAARAARARARAEEEESRVHQASTAAAHHPSPLTDSLLHTDACGGRQTSAHKAEQRAAQWMRRVCSQLRPAACASPGAHADSDSDDAEVSQP